MELQLLRSATMLLTLGQERLIIDPMLGEVGSMPGFKFVGGGRKRNPLVALPEAATQALESATGVLLTHEHPDHFDLAGLRWAKERKLPVWTNGIDLPSLRKKGLDVRLLEEGALGLQVETVRSRHGTGLLGWMLGPVAGYFLAHPKEPSIYVTGDSVLTESVLDAITRLEPDILLAPAGSANMGIGGDILFSLDELVTLANATRGKVVFNHLEALDHCPTTRAMLKERMTREGVMERVWIPEDGETLHFERTPGEARKAPTKKPDVETPGMQKWMTAPFAGT